MECLLAKPRSFSNLPGFLDFHSSILSCSYYINVYIIYKNIFLKIVKDEIYIMKAISIHGNDWAHNWAEIEESKTYKNWVNLIISEFKTPFEERFHAFSDLGTFLAGDVFLEVSLISLISPQNLIKLVFRRAAERTLSKPWFK